MIEYLPRNKLEFEVQSQTGKTSCNAPAGSWLFARARARRRVGAGSALSNKTQQGLRFIVEQGAMRRIEGGESGRGGAARPPRPSPQLNIHS